MIEITEGEEGMTRVSTFEVPRDAVPAMVEHLGGAGDTLATRSGGLISAAVLVAKDLPGQPLADQVRVVHHARWSSAADADAGADVLAPAVPGLREAAASAVVHDQELRAVVSAAPGKVLQVTEEGPTTLLITLDAKPGEHDFLVDFNVSDTDTLFADRPGFVGASIYADTAGTRIFELVQWATPQDFAAVAASPEFAEHNDTAVARATASTAGPYDVAHTTGGAA